VIGTRHTERVSQLAEHHAQARFVALPSGDVAVLDAAPTSVPRGTALLVPGFTGSKEDFAPILDPLREAGYRTVALDLPGQYQSPGPDDRSRYTPDDLARVVTQLADTLGNEPVHLLGHSFGGLVARAAVLAEPARYRSLVLLCSGPAAMDHGRGALLAQLEPFAGEGMAAVHAALESLQPDGTPLPAELAAFMRERFVASSVAGFFGMAAAIGAEPDRVDALRDSGVPTLVCFGERDTGWPLAEQRAMTGRLGAQLTVIAEAGHSPAVDRPTQTAAALTAFWATHTNGVAGVP
jgi:pimeloyl-ACP methyl ester carboxylesterase